MGTIDVLNSVIVSKLDSLNNIIELCLSCNDIPIRDLDNLSYDCNGIKSGVERLALDYHLATAGILSDYYSLPTNITDDEVCDEVTVAKSSELLHKFQTTLCRLNIINKMDHIFKLLEYACSTIVPKNISNRDRVALNQCIKVYKSGKIGKISNEEKYTICPFCDTKMIVRPSENKMLCIKCGLVEQLDIISPDDDQNYNQEGKRSKHGSYDVTGHCRAWVERIQARESVDIPERIIKSVKKNILSSGIIDLNEVTCSQIRDILRLKKLSSYYVHIPLIRKLITGRSPPQLTDKEFQLTLLYFSKFITIFDQIKPNNKTNCPYHPYFIYKIWEHILDNDNEVSDFNEKVENYKILTDDDNWKIPKEKKSNNEDQYYTIRYSQRKKEILSYIHLQSRDTLIENDTIVREICKRIPRFRYIPTNRNINTR